MIRIENRTHRRIEMEIPAGVAVVSSFLGHFIRRPQFRCVTKDVSVRGMKLVSDHPIPEGATVKLWVTGPDAGKTATWSLRGRVCWAITQSKGARFLAGIRLDDQPAAAMAVWTEAIREQIREHFRSPVPVVATQ
jgi:hypothetical protein